MAFPFLAALGMGGAAAGGAGAAGAGAGGLSGIGALGGMRGLASMGGGKSGGGGMGGGGVPGGAAGGAILGALKGFLIDSPMDKRKRQTIAEQNTFSPWTGTKYDYPEMRNPWHTLLQGLAAGMQSSPGAKMMGGGGGGGMMSGLGDMVAPQRQPSSGPIYPMANPGKIDMNPWLGLMSMGQ
jgi:hypothetical protein